MTSSPDAVRAILRELQEYLSEEHLRTLIDAPIDAVCARFAGAPCACGSRDAFHELLACFMQALHVEALQPARRVTTETALAEALALLEMAVPTAPPDRYDTAWASVQEAGEQGAAGILHLLADALRSRQRHAYIQWRVVSLLDPTDKALRRALVEALRGDMATGQFDDLLQTPTTALAPHVLRLVSCLGGLDPRDAAALSWFGD
jgi:hypothetical protein